MDGKKNLMQWGLCTKFQLFPVIFFSRPHTSVRPSVRPLAAVSVRRSVHWLKGLQKIEVDKTWLSRKI